MADLGMLRMDFFTDGTDALGMIFWRGFKDILVQVSTIRMEECAELVYENRTSQGIFSAPTFPYLIELFSCLLSDCSRFERIACDRVYIDIAIGVDIDILELAVDIIIDLPFKPTVFRSDIDGIEPVLICVCDQVEEQPGVGILGVPDEHLIVLQTLIDSFNDVYQVPIQVARLIRIGFVP